MSEENLNFTDICHLINITEDKLKNSYARNCLRKSVLIIVIMKKLAKEREQNRRGTELGSMAHHNATLASTRRKLF
ncbi:hypothetical protein TNCT_495961 [Trichonephila clavata]|uniref:Uncharacterized protein n=1 Tax=Trichonephila clavata TaxID=2740835 RepID=A0A8X6KU27_TRICU|nr:hypothetical protein TNCT_495931 [Trichonephila clavata]GFQ86616.1 hypothetical protein TNCT_495941 [Trichonephila clavata]GFQ86617.1 hypothetical protein TNCT_495951 [Trichonephila clavata]GFQ86618.1 hypothetical protein TNCT_495961 [Trichonephila clavata]